MSHSLLVQSWNEKLAPRPLLYGTAHIIVKKWEDNLTEWEDNTWGATCNIGKKQKNLQAENTTWNHSSEESFGLKQ